MMLAVAVMIITAASTRLKADTGMCGGASTTLPFTDVVSSNIFFCAIAEAYFTGLTNGTSPTTYSPSDPVTREQMAAFTTRTLDQSLKRGNRRAALNQFWTTAPFYEDTFAAGIMGTTTVGDGPKLVASDGADLWVANFYSGTVSRVRASDGKLLGTWTGATYAYGVLVAMGRVFVTGETAPGGRLYVIDPSQPPGPVTVLSGGLGYDPKSIAFDGTRIWTANGDSISIINPGAPLGLNMVTNRPGFTFAQGILYDGANIWVTEYGNSLKKLDANGAVIATVTVGGESEFPVYDGANIWVPNYGNSTVTVVRPSDGVVLATLTGNGLNAPVSAAFDGQRILVTNYVGNSVSIFRASDFAALGTVSASANTTAPWGACSDGQYFWITLGSANKLARF